MYTRVLFCVFVCGVCASHDTLYEGHKLVRVLPRNASQLQSLLNVKDQRDNLDGVQFWDDRYLVDRPSLIQLAPHAVTSFMEELERHDLLSDTAADNLQSMINEQMKSLRRKKRSEPNSIVDQGGFSFEIYHPLNEIYDYLNGLPSKHQDVRVSTVTQTYEGRDIKLVRVGDGTKPAVYVECAIHAREWISPAVCLNILNDLVTNESDEIKNLRATNDFYMLPITNPDGYDYTWTGDRLWRKNRRPMGQCFGVDLNRNFDSRFGGPGSYSVKCSDLYHGPYAFSEKESQAEKQVIESLKDLHSVWSIHSYSELFMYPYCSTYNKSNDEAELFALSRKAAEKIKSVNGIDYGYGSCANTVYICSGTMTDWAYEALGMKYSFDIELRDSKDGLYGFLLPPEEIIPTFNEFWAAMKLTINQINANK